jgi:tetratricopeptide (TPR) repeat protein
MVSRGMAFLKSADGHIKDGLKHLQKWELEKALKSFQNAEKKKPENPDIMNYLSQTYAAMDDMDKATEYILKAITLQPQSPTHKQLYATYLMRQGKNEEAIPFIDEALELQPIDVMYIMRGQVDYNMGNIESAQGFFEKALELDPNNPLANHMEGLVFYRQARFEEAIPHIEKALEIGELTSLRTILEDCKAKTGKQD